MTAKQTGIDWNNILANVGNHLNDWVNTLAHSLGVAANYLMEMEIKQMYIVGFNRALWALAGLSVLVTCLVILLKTRKKCSLDAERHCSLFGQSRRQWDTL